ncbi:MAG: 30S ribosome-binding factor RbfA [candidate division Zixibacteria bacterium]|nr:30S ribosome-binding factor RbfA [candidate division Zixibacteria bacterium]
MRQFRRSDRLGEQILRDISEVTQTELRDDFPAMITYTHVRLSGDLRYATVFYSVLGDEKTREAVVEALARNARKLRGLVGKRLHVRRIPEFHFKFDPSIEEGMKIEKLLNQVRTDDHE